MKPAASSRKRAISIATIVGMLIFWWYFKPSLWLGLFAAILAGFLVFYAVTTIKIQRFQRVFFIGLFVLTLVTTMASIFLYTGIGQFTLWASAYHKLVQFTPGNQIGVSLFPCAIQVPQVSVGLDPPISEVGAWQTQLPQGLNRFLWTTMPFLKPCYSNVIIITIPVLLVLFLFGRGFCGWICPFGGLPELCAIGRKARWGMTLFKERTVTEDLRYAGLKGWVKDTKYGILFVLVMLAIVFAIPLICIFCPTLWAENKYVFWALLGVFFVFAIVLPFMTKRKWFCLTICPVAPVLALLDKISFFRPRLNNEKCDKCNACVLECNMYAITLRDVAEGKSPDGDCTRCGRCVDVCPKEAIDLYWVGIPRFTGGYRKARTLFITLVITAAFVCYVWLTAVINNFLGNS